ncbi:MAG: hypothetical protein NEHIOOID_00678 [Holosporales bacterium]
MKGNIMEKVLKMFVLVVGLWASAFAATLPIGFDPEIYLGNYLDLQNAAPKDQSRANWARDHYLRNGVNEGRVGNVKLKTQVSGATAPSNLPFDARTYLDNYVDIKTRLGNDEKRATDHYNQYYKDKKNNHVNGHIGNQQFAAPVWTTGVPGDFNPQQYLANYPDVAKSLETVQGDERLIRAAEHYRDSGFKEGRTYKPLIVLPGNASSGKMGGFYLEQVDQYFITGSGQPASSVLSAAPTPNSLQRNNVYACAVPLVYGGNDYQIAIGYVSDNKCLYEAWKDQEQPMGNGAYYINAKGTFKQKVTSVLFKPKGTVSVRQSSVVKIGTGFGKTHDGVEKSSTEMIPYYHSNQAKPVAPAGPFLRLDLTDQSEKDEIILPGSMLGFRLDQVDQFFTSGSGQPASSVLSVVPAPNSLQRDGVYACAVPLNNNNSYQIAIGYVSGSKCLYEAWGSQAQDMGNGAYYFNAKGTFKKNVTSVLFNVKQGVGGSQTGVVKIGVGFGKTQDNANQNTQKIGFAKNSGLPDGVVYGFDLADQSEKDEDKVVAPVTAPAPVVAPAPVTAPVTAPAPVVAPAPVTAPVTAPAPVVAPAPVTAPVMAPATTSSGLKSISSTSNETVVLSTFTLTNGVTLSDAKNANNNLKDMAGNNVCMFGLQNNADTQAIVGYEKDGLCYGAGWNVSHKVAIGQGAYYVAAMGGSFKKRSDVGANYANSALFINKANPQMSTGIAIKAGSNLASKTMPTHSTENAKISYVQNMNGTAGNFDALSDNDMIYTMDAPAQPGQPGGVPAQAGQPGQPGGVPAQPAQAGQPGGAPAQPLGATQGQQTKMAGVFNRDGMNFNLASNITFVADVNDATALKTQSNKKVCAAYHKYSDFAKVLRFGFVTAGNTCAIAALNVQPKAFGTNEAFAVQAQGTWLDVKDQNAIAYMNKGQTLVNDPASSGFLAEVNGASVGMYYPGSAPTVVYAKDDSGVAVLEPYSAQSVKIFVPN